MIRKRTRLKSLAARVVLLTFVLAMLAVSVVSLSALVGVYDLARREVTARHHAYLQALVGDIEIRLDAADRVVTRAAAIGLEPVSGEVDRAAIAAQYEMGIEYVDQLLLTTRDGTVVSGYPALRTPRSIMGEPLLATATTESVRYRYGRLADEQQASLWAARAVTGDADLVMMARVRSGFLGPAVERWSDQDVGRWVLLMQQDGAAIVMSAGAEGVAQDGMVYTPPADAPGIGAVEAITHDATVLWGHYVDIDAHPGISWRGVIVEPRNAVVLATIGALAPAVAALVASGLATLAIVTVFARRLVAPLSQLEARARDAVTGAYVRPLQSDRADEVGRLAAAFNAIALRLNALHDLSQLLASSSRLDQVLDGITSAMGHIVGTATVAVFLVDEHARCLTLARARDLGAESTPDLPLDADSWLIRAMKAGDPLISTLDASELHAIAPGEYGPRVTVLTAPLAVGAEPLGVIAVIEDGVRTFSDAEMEMVRTFSAQAAVAVFNSRLFEVESRSRTEAEVLRAVAENLSRPQDLAVALDTIEETTAVLLGASDTVLAVSDRPRFGLPAASDGGSERELLEAWEAGFDEGQQTMTVDASSGPHAVRLLEGASAQRVLLAAVGIDGETCGVLGFFRAGSRQFTAREHRLATAVASQLALALESAQNFERARTRAVNLETIFRISQAVSSSLQTKVVLNRVLDVVQKIFAADAVSLMTYETGSQELQTEMARGMISPAMLGYRTEPGSDVPGAVFSSGDPVRVGRIDEAGDGIGALALAQGLRSMLAVPLLARGRSIGVLSVFSAMPDAFTDEDMGLLHTFAAQAALAIDTAKLYGKEHFVASVLQASILPKTLPDFPEIESSSLYLPAGVEAEIGGDYFDLFRAPGTGIFLVMGDVCGKGVVAATKTSRIKYTVRGLAAAGLGPDEIISEVNRMVSETNEPSDIVTLWIGRVDVDSGTLSYANGGHPPALLRRTLPTSSVVRLLPTGPLLGATPLARYECVSVPIGEGDMLVLYTDGVTEARRGNRFFGEGRVQRALRQGMDADDVTRRLLAALERFVPGAIRDDAAVLAVRIMARGQQVGSS
ncbi:MAG TPA: SpoIIE family protein phosphatase [Coriobacteriia bacterium]|nr:SpoIIE family protein phosphatase [Coriobacteriia bacterium]